MPPSPDKALVLIVVRAIANCWLEHYHWRVVPFLEVLAGRVIDTVIALNEQHHQADLTTQFAHA